MDHQIAMLWMRGSLSFLEQLCVKSFLDAGHHVILYSYEPIGRVPEGVDFRDAGEILSETGFLVHERTGSPALHSDLFRYRLLEKGDRVIWADTDAYCRRRFAPVDGHLYGWESAHHVNGGVLGLPPESETLRALLDFTTDEFAIPPWEKPERRNAWIAAKEAGEPVHVGEQTWGVWGPHAITHFLHETGEIERALPQVALYPYSFADRRKLLVTGRDHGTAITEETQSIHLYGRRIRKRMAERDHGLPHPDSLMGTLLQKHQIDPCDAPLRDWPNPDRNSPFAKIYREAAHGKSYASAAPAVRPLESVVAVTAMRNEGAFLLDWIAHHVEVGVTHFLIYSYASDDQTEAILDALVKRGIVTHERLSLQPGDRALRRAIELANDHSAVRAADAVYVTDIDEFIDVHVGDGTLSALFEAAGDPDMISMPWRIFGSSGAVDYDPRPVPEQFRKAAPEKVRKPALNWGFKTIQRRGAPFTRLGIHRPLDPTGGMPRWVDGCGRPLPEKYLAKGWRMNIDCWGYDLVTLNRYAARSLDSFLVRHAEDRDGFGGATRDLAYWQAHDRNDEEVPSIGDVWGRARILRDVWRRDPELGPLHDRAVDWHRARAAECRASPEAAGLLAQIAPELGAANQPFAFRSTRAAGVAPPAPQAAVVDVPLTGSAATERYHGIMERQTRNLGKLASPAETPPPAEKIVIVTSMKNEGCFILEWIAYHMSIGVTHFLVYTNDCDDPTNTVLDRLSAMGIVTRRDNPFNREAGQKPQRGALNDAAEQDIVKEADWVGVIDVDEFVNIHVGDGTFHALLAEMRHPTVISMTWRFFGNRGVHAYEDKWQTEIFTRAAPLYIPKPRLGWGFKSFQSGDAPFGKLGVHRPLQLAEEHADDVRWVNGSGNVMHPRVLGKNEWFSRKDTIGYDMVTLNHYILRSAESFLVKRQRGRINHVDQDQGVHYWTARNYATDEDTSIHRHLPRARRAWDNLMADRDLGALHAEAVGWHEAKIAELMALPDYRSLYAAITDPSLPDAIYRKRERNEATEEPVAAE